MLYVLIFFQKNGKLFCVISIYPKRREVLRKIININDKWMFFGPDKKGVEVNLPHTWNAVDGQDGGNDYWRGTCVYTKEFESPVWDKERERVYLQFEGVSASAKVYINGHLCADHHGGYSTFRADVSDFLEDENILEVKVDNSVNDKVYPQKADFTFYGGIYRDVTLLVVNKYHFDLDYYGGVGVRITSYIKNTDAKVEVVSNHNAPKGQVRVRIFNREGSQVTKGEGDDIALSIPKVHLWNGLEDPYLYSAELKLVVEEQVVDALTIPFGVRECSVDPEKGFFLNGNSYPLRGVARHQDRKGIGNALSKKHHKEDIDLIREIGANSVRLAHYQHDQYFYDLCDKYGIIVWAEIPYISSHMPNGRENAIMQMKELIVQNYNHPSIVTWGLSNEITIDTKDKEDMLSLHRELNDLCHKMDTTRPTSLACFAMCSPFHKSAHITDLVGWNLYLGWYVPGLYLNDLWISFFHKCYPNRPLGFSEYGCEGMPNLHSSKPRRGDHTEEYQALYHEYMLKCFERHPYMWGNYVWNMFDFAADARNQGGEAGMNHKGLVTFDRKIKKDSFYLYKAYWSKTPFVHLAGSRYKNRAEAVTTIKVYSNQKEVSLYHNGKLIGKQKGECVFSFRVPLETKNHIKALSGDCEDCMVIYKTDKPNAEYKLRDKTSNSTNWV